MVADAAELSVTRRRPALAFFLCLAVRHQRPHLSALWFHRAAFPARPGAHAYGYTECRPLDHRSSETQARARRRSQTLQCAAEADLSDRGFRVAAADDFDRPYHVARRGFRRALAARDFRRAAIGANTPLHCRDSDCAFRLGAPYRSAAF